MPDEREHAETQVTRRSRLRHLVSGSKAIVAIAGGLVTIAAAVTLVLTTIRDVREKDPPTDAERLEQLQGGMTFGRFRATIGAEPDVQQPAGDAPDARFLKGKGAKRYVFVRPDAFVQAVVADNTVVGFLIVVRTRKLQPKFTWRTARSPVTLGRSTFVDYEPDRLGGFCGANRAQYFEAFGGGNDNNAQEFAVGVSSIGLNGDRVFDSVCAVSEPLADCDAAAAYVNVILQPASARCFLSADESGPLRRLPINAYVETAPTTPLFSELLAPLEPEVAGIAPAS